jgi:hypothetical protein
MKDCCGKPKLCEVAKKIIVNEDILHDTEWEGEVHILKEVHVRAPAVLFIHPGTRVKLAAGKLCCPSSLPFASLVIDSGASIRAHGAVFESAAEAPNTTGGVIILGTADDKDLKGKFPKVFENYPTVVAREVPAGFSKLSNCNFNNLGNNFADINALTLFRVKDSSEVFLSCINIFWAGDDGLEIFGGTHSIDQLSIIQAIDDGLDLDWNAELLITESLLIQKGNSTGLIEVIGALGTTNAVALQNGALFSLDGRITDKTDGTTTFGGSWGPAGENFVAGQQVAASGTAEMLGGVQTSIVGSI